MRDQRRVHEMLADEPDLPLTLAAQTGTSSAIGSRATVP
jgi:hypothetical protein